METANSYTQVVEKGRQTKKCRNMFPTHVGNIFPTLYVGVKVGRI